LTIPTNIPLLVALFIVGGISYRLGGHLYDLARSAFLRWRRGKETVWIVGKVLGDSPKGRVWDLVGVFMDRQEAVDQCPNRDYFIGPARMNEAIPAAVQEWQGVEFPRSFPREVSA